MRKNNLPTLREDSEEKVDILCDAIAKLEAKSGLKIKHFSAYFDRTETDRGGITCGLSSLNVDFVLPAFFCEG